MKKRPLEDLFFAMYRGKQSFEHFANGSVGSLYESATVNGRVVYKADKELRAYHRFLNKFLFERLPVVDDVVFSYRKGVNAVDAVEKHAESKFYFQTDLKDFFGSLNRSDVRRTLGWAVDTCVVSDLDIWIERILELVTIGDSLPMGFSTSPAISNACLYSLDLILTAHCLDNGVIYTRYADDLIFSSSNEQALDPLFGVVCRTLESEFFGRLGINTGKTKYTRKGGKIKLLGLNVLPNGRVTVDMRYKKDIEVRLFYYVKDRARFLKIMDAADDEKAIKKFSGLINYVNTVDPAYLDKLRKKYGSTIVDMFIHKSPKL
ncbi:reverse transcriptase domain-containing protein [Pseudomonas sp. PDM19]|uniref:reverse transcriptase domain-containing protein n=1 Tax=Pseudomonas sp. PDM19 TaxID=2769272 RepID=UPI00177E6DB3|nr:reverse transcriptase domain-containing protein [Pseudomonas sp. PDM19]MBD9633512.1 RNA-directed DNA polymerase [Pseudomonas sp. PDM19]